MQTVQPCRVFDTAKAKRDHLWAVQQLQAGKLLLWVTSKTVVDIEAVVACHVRKKTMFSLEFQRLSSLIPFAVVCQLNMTTALVPLCPCAWHPLRPSCACVQSRTQCHCTCRECTAHLLGQSSGCRVLLETAEDLAAAKWGLRKNRDVENLRFRNEAQLVNAELQVVEPWPVNLPQSASSFEHLSLTPSSWPAKTHCIPQEAEESHAGTRVCGEENPVSLESFDKLEKRCAVLEQAVLAQKGLDERLTRVEAQVEQILARLTKTSDSKSDDGDSSYVKAGTKCRASTET